MRSSPIVNDIDPPQFKLKTQDLENEEIVGT